MIEPTEQDIGRKVKFTRKGFFGKSDEIVYGNLMSFSETCGFIHWDHRNNEYMWISFLSELEWSKKK